jgi:peroxiredoxin
MAQFGPEVTQQIRDLGAGFAFIAAEKRGGMFKPEQFLRKNPVPFPFLLDEDRTVTKAYGVYHRIGHDALNIARPATFVVAADGTIGWIFVGSSQTDRAPTEKMLEAIAAAKSSC